MISNLMLGQTIILGAAIEPGVEKAVTWFNKHGFETEWSGAWDTHFRQFGGKSNSSFIAFKKALPEQILLSLHKVKDLIIRNDGKHIKFLYKEKYNQPFVQNKWDEVIRTLEKNL